jgi:hypothetical protein
MRLNTTAFAEAFMRDVPTADLPDSADADARVELVRGQLVCAAWTLAAVVRSSRLIAADVDPVEVVNKAMTKADLPFRLEASH